MGDLKEWEQLGLTDLVHLNEYTKEKILSGGYKTTFHALDVHWVEPICPGIPDGRYVYFQQSNSTFLMWNFSHQRLAKWDGFGYPAPRASTGGCSSLGLDSKGNYGLVYKATENTGGIYRTRVRSNEYQEEYIKPINIRHIPKLGWSFH